MFCIYYSTQGKTVKSNIQPTNVDYQAEIYDRFAVCKLKQIFSVSQDDITEGTYQFPVDYNSAFCDLTVTTPREVLKGMVKEKKEARNIYETAKKEGRQTFLTEESSSDRDIYKLSMGNILKDDTIIVEYIYISEVTYNNEKYIFYIPSYVSPRYGGEYIPNPKHAVSARVKICNPIKNIKFSVPEVIISMDGNYIVGEFSSSTILDKDIEVTYDYQTSTDGCAYVFNANGYNMGIVSVVPQIKKEMNTDGIVFILDCSGSMSGERMENSKKAIIYCLEKMLDTDNTFNIIRYGSSYDIYEKQMLKCTSSNIKCAIQYCKSISADMGGTETQNALEACLNKCGCKTAILITDGDTSNNDTLHRLCKKFDALSILGIGSGINRANIDDMARCGSGMALFSQTDNNIIENMNMLINVTLIPSIKNSVSNWQCKENFTTNHALIMNRPYLEYVISKEKISGYLLENDKLEQSIKLDPMGNVPIDPVYLGALVAKRIVQENDVDESFTKEQMIDLAVNFNIITKHTSFVAVGNKVRCNEPHSEPTTMTEVRRGTQGMMGSIGNPCPCGPSGIQCIGSSMKNGTSVSGCPNVSGYPNPKFASSPWSNCNTSMNGNARVCYSQDMAKTTIRENTITLPNSSRNMAKTIIRKNTITLPHQTMMTPISQQCYAPTDLRDIARTTIRENTVGLPYQTMTTLTECKKTNSSQDDHTDYLFDYFCNEEKFNEQLREKWDEDIQNRLNSRKEETKSSQTGGLSGDDSNESSDKEENNSNEMGGFLEDSSDECCKKKENGSPEMGGLFGDSSEECCKKEENSGKNTYARITDTIESISHVDFSIYRNKSVLQDSLISDPNDITVAEIYNNGDPVQGGAIDRRLGVTEYKLESSTCGEIYTKCPGQIRVTKSKQDDKSDTISLDNDKYFDALKQYFDFKRGSFMSGVIKIIKSVPLVLCTDAKALTIFVMKWIKTNLNSDVFDFFNKVVMSKNPLWNTN